MFKKFFVLIFLVWGGLYIQAFAAPTLHISEENGSVGEYVNVVISVTDNPGIATFILKLHFDKENLAPISIAKGQALTEGEIISNIQLGDVSDFDSVSIVWINAWDISENGELLRITFKIKEGAKGTLPLNLSYNVGDICNQNFDDVFFDVNNGKVDVIQPASTEETTPNTPSAPSAPINIGGGYPILSTTTQTPQEQLASIVFQDISDYPWAENEIMALAQKGVINGTSLDTFNPERNIKRADFLLMLVRLLNLKADFTDNFDDVPHDAYYYNQLGIARKTGVAKGIGQNKFAPESFITRQDMFVLAFRILKELGLETKEDTLSQFEDAEDISDYALEALCTLVAHGHIKGSENKIEPLNFTTRAETAVFVYRISDILQHVENP